MTLAPRWRKLMGDFGATRGRIALMLAALTIGMEVHRPQRRLNATGLRGPLAAAVARCQDRATRTHCPTALPIGRDGETED